MKKLAVISIFLIIYACNSARKLPEPAMNSSWKTKVIEPSPQIGGGDPEAGLDFLIYGNYLGSGIPYEVLKKRFMGDGGSNILQREGLNAGAPYMMTIFETEKGQMVGNGNCFACHAGKFDGEVILGLGNSFSEYKQNWTMGARVINIGMDLKYNKNSEEWQAFQPFGKFFKAMAPYIETEQNGVNPAAMLAEACVRHRDPVTLEYVEEPNFEMPDYVISTDVPPLWHVAKKNALYYTAVGRGDFTKLLFQASVLGIPDSAAARYAVTNFADVVAWLKSLEPPEYPGVIDEELAAKGEMIFNEHCADCHGTYGKWDSYPNKVVSLDEVKTDPLYASYAVEAPIVDWYNKSWFAASEPRSCFEPEAGYIAPPLDGIWITAPYLHNGSVPTLDALLNSNLRPAYWVRSGDSSDYDYDRIGWKYATEENNKAKWSYDTRLPGMSNQGHYYGDELNAEQRKAVLEYLKKL